MRLLLLAGATCALLFSACGGRTRNPAPAAPVRLQVTAPGDLGSVHGQTVTVRGTVRPGTATVTVRGRRATVSGGSWSSDVRLDPGVNVIDVLASADRGRPALTALRVRRIVTIAVPDVTGQSVADATRQLEDRGLKADVQTAGGDFFDKLLGGNPNVCDTTPGAGEQVDPGTTILVRASRRC
jgi:hypothetical protein